MKKLWLTLLLFPFLTYAQWVNDPSENTIINDVPGAHYVPKIAVTPEGNYFFSWYGGASNLNMNLAYADHSGISLWDNDMVVSDYAQNSWVDDYTMLSDLEGNAIIIFSDIRNGNKDVVVYKVDSLGNQLWGENGIVFPISGTGEYQPHAIVSSENNIFILYSTNFDNGSSNITKAHKIEPDGNLAWGDEGKTFSGFGASWALPKGIANNDGGFSFAFYKETGTFPSLTREIYAIRCDSDGEMIWPSITKIVDAGGISSWDNIKIYGNGNGGLYCTWHDDRYFNNTSEVYAQYINPEGVEQWNENGLLLGSEQSGHQLYEIPSGLNQSGEFIVFWNLLNSNQSEGALKYQRISSDGLLLEGNTGATIIGMNAQLQNGLRAYQMGDTTFYLYTYFTPGSSYLTTYNMLALDANGEQVWNNPIELTNSNLERNHAQMSDFHSNQTVICWADNFTVGSRIMAQNIFIDGNLGSSPVNTIELQNKTDKQYFKSYHPLSKTIIIENTLPGDILKIYNIQGQEIYMKMAKNHQVINKLNKGLFLAILSRNGKAIESYKFIP